jgi:hypothetical protein
LNERPSEASGPPPAPRDDAHRRSEVARLTAVLETAEPGLSICGISGPGGVGKSYLLRHVLDGLDLRHTLKLEVDGSNEQARGDLFGLLDGQLARRSLPAPAKAKHDYFPHLRRVAAIHRDLVEAVTAELQAGAAPIEVKAAAVALLKAGRRLNQAVPITREYLDLSSSLFKEADLGRTLDEVWDTVRRLDALRDSTAIPGPIRDLLGLSYRSRVKNDLYNVTADALLTDLAAAIGGYRKEDRFRFTEAPIPGARRLLLIVDDFEALAPVLEELLVGALCPRLGDAPFPTTLIVLCRDDLEAMHPAWGQHCRKFLRDQIRLAPFDHATAMALLAGAGVPEARREALYQATQGFPFLLSLLAEQLGAEEADTALFLRKFFDRTTRWMSSRQREWFVRICYLEGVNVDTLAPLFPGEDVDAIQDWFEREASIRDPASAVFRVRPLIREKVLRYQELRSPSRHREMQGRASALKSPGV